MSIEMMFSVFHLNIVITTSRTLIYAAYSIK